jgi:hypothetical protein
MALLDRVWPEVCSVARGYVGRAVRWVGSEGNMSAAGLPPAWSVEQVKGWVQAVAHKK